MIKKRNFWAVLDNALISFLSQKTQSEILKNFLFQKKYNLSFYSIEDEHTYINNVKLLKHLYEKPKVKGFIFFSLLQISYKEGDNLKLIEKIIKKKYEIIFFRENIHIKNMQELKKNIKKIKLFRNLNKSLIKKQKSLIN